MASTLLGGGRIQQAGPEEGLPERATAPELCAYYGQVMQRMVQPGKVTFYPNCEHLGEGQLVSRLSGRRYEVRVRRCRRRRALPVPAGPLDDSCTVRRR